MRYTAFKFCIVLGLTISVSGSPAAAPAADVTTSGSAFESIGPLTFTLTACCLPPILRLRRSTRSISEARRRRRAGHEGRSRHRSADCGAARHRRPRGLGHRSGRAPEIAQRVHFRHARTGRGREARTAAGRRRRQDRHRRSRDVEGDEGRAAKSTEPDRPGSCPAARPVDHRHGLHGRPAVRRGVVERGVCIDAAGAPFPFKTADNGTSVEIYHGAHGQFETRSPVRTFVPTRSATSRTLSRPTPARRSSSSR